MSNVDAVFKSIKNQLSMKVDKATKKATSFLYNRLQDNYGNSSPEGVSLAPHSGATKILHPETSGILSRSGASKKSIKRESIFGSGLLGVKTGKSNIRVTSWKLALHERGTSMAVTDKTKDFYMKSGLQIKKNRITIPPRPVFSITMNSQRMQSDIIAEIASVII